MTVERVDGTLDGGCRVELPEDTVPVTVSIKDG
jgi:hypothetical protein